MFDEMESISSFIRDRLPSSVYSLGLPSSRLYMGAVWNTSSWKSLYEISGDL